MLYDLKIPSTCSWIVDEGLLLTQSSCVLQRSEIPRPPQLLMIDLRSKGSPGAGLMKLADFDGKTISLLKMIGSKWYLGVDNRLLVSDDLKSWKIVLKGSDIGSVFWHIVEANDRTFFAQEYSYNCSSLYRSLDGGESWLQIITSRKIDRRARHFHSIAYDAPRGLLIATLGDSNLIKIATSTDYGDTWKPVNRQAYQCLPIEVLENSVVFGMDSVVSRGLLVWQSGRSSWQTIHLKVKGKLETQDILQASDLKKLKNGYWIMTTGGGSILVSRSLKSWALVKIGQSSEFEFHPISNEKNGHVAISMGDTTMLLDSSIVEIEDDYERIVESRAFLSRLKALGYVAKRLPHRTRLG